MTVYMYEDMYLCDACYCDACDEAEARGRSRYYNKEQDPFYYPIELTDKPENAPAYCEGDFCTHELEWED